VRDHLQVLGLLVGTVLGAIPFLLHLLVSPVATPIARRRLARRLGGPAPALFEPDAPDPAAWAGKSVFVVAGEPSGDRLAGLVVRALLARAPGLRVEGFAGPEAERAGARLHRDLVEHAVVGFVAVARSLGLWWGVCAEALARFREDPPDLLLTVDFPGLNLRLARWARRRGIRTVHLVAPQTWAWAPWRLGRVRRAVDQLLVTFPFEEAVFREAGVNAAYVGHPLFETPLPAPASPERPPTDGVWIELRPGSRRKELGRQGPIVLDAAKRIAASRPGTRFLVRLASARSETLFRDLLARHRGLPGLEMRVGAGREEPAFAAALTTSGTSTAELAVAQVPMAVFYRVSALGRLAARLLVTSPFVALPNLLAGRRIVSERLVGRGGGARLAEDVLGLLSDPSRWRESRADLGRIRASVGHPAVADRVARATLAGGPRKA
jgi:lipid-A-disaccharide synthase